LEQQKQSMQLDIAALCRSAGGTKFLPLKMHVAISSKVSTIRLYKNHSLILMNTRRRKPVVRLCISKYKSFKKSLGLFRPFDYIYVSHVLADLARTLKKS